MKNIMNSDLVNEEFELQKTLEEDLLIDTEMWKYREYIKEMVLNKLMYWKRYEDWYHYEIEDSVNNFSRNSRETILNIAKRTNNLLLNNK